MSCLMELSLYSCLSLHIVLSVSYSIVVTCYDRLALLYVMFSCVFFHFCIWCSGSVVVFDCIVPDLCLLPYVYNHSQGRATDPLWNIKWDSPASDSCYLALPRTIFHGCHIVHWDPLKAKWRCLKNIGTGYVKMHGLSSNLIKPMPLIPKPHF